MKNQARRLVGARPISTSGLILRRIVNQVRITTRDIAESAQNARHRQAGPSVKERQDQLLTFYEGFEDLVEMLCDAAQYGPMPRLETGYQARREWLGARYEEIKPLLSAFVRPDQSIGQDAFESLLSPRTVSEFLQSDDGETIARITRAREALNLYAEHLRHLANRTG